MKKTKTILLISQVYFPDSPSVGQHLFDISRELVAQGYRVIVYTPRGGYDDPSVRFPRRDVVDGILIRRLPFCAFGKHPISLRLASGLSLVLQAIFRGLWIKGLNGVLISTAPPMSGFASWVIKRIRGVRVVYWVMDLNPDQMIVAGRLDPRSWTAKLSERVNRMTLRHSDEVVALDRYMADRLKQKTPLEEKLSIIAPWPYENQRVDISHDQNPFRRTHHFNNRFVVMYSGNISDVHPMETYLEGMRRLKSDDRYLFVFIGAPAALRAMEAFARKNEIKNMFTLPYVPFSETKFSLSAADLHVVIMGNEMVGIVHPCKIYGIMSVGRPFLAISPKRSHIGEIVDAANVGWRVDHRDVEGVVKALETARSLPQKDLQAMGVKGREIIDTHYSRQVLCGRFCQLFR